MMIMRRGEGYPGDIADEKGACSFWISVSVNEYKRGKKGLPVSAQKVDGPEGELIETSRMRPSAAAMAQTPTPKRRHRSVFWRQPICNLSTMGRGMASNGMSVRMLRLPIISSMW